MKMLLASLFVLFLFACGNDEPKKDDVIFFQPKLFFQQQLADIKKTPYFIYKIESINNRRDSSVISVDSFEHFMQPFLEADINDPAIKKFYEESVFQDATTNSFSLSYTTSNKELDVQNMNVLLREDGETVKNIFIRKYETEDGKSIIEQLSWKPNEHYEVNSLIQSPNKEETVHKVQVVWNNK